MSIAYADGVFEELIEISFYLSDIQEELAQRFLNSCDETFHDLARNKYLGVERKFRHVELSKVRMWRVKAFEKYLVFYVPTETGVKILHVVHSSIDYSKLFKSS